MGLLADWQIRAETGMIEPFAPAQQRAGVVSYGVSSYGYDMRIADEWKIVTPGDAVLDPKRVDDRVFRDLRADVIDIMPHTFVLGRSVERFRIPRNVLAIVLGKSTYARCGLIVNVTPLEPAWEGYVTIELSNTAPVPIRIYANEGIAQVLFLEGSARCQESYADKRGKYQHQVGVVPARIEEA